MLLSKVDVAEASAHTLAGIGRTAIESVILGRALRRVLADDVSSPLSLPPWNCASMDGYAVHADDVHNISDGEPARLRVVGSTAAGAHAAPSLRAGEAVRVMTGAPIPDGADTVIRVEDVETTDRSVSIVNTRDAGRNVRRRGEEVEAGQLVLPAGTVLGAPHLGVLASVGYALVRVHRRPRVAILATGDEIVPVERFAEVLGGDRIVSSNSYSLAAAVELAGGDPISLRIAPDDRDLLRMRLREAEGCDLLLTTGGVSVGDLDHTRSVVEEVGGSVTMWRVRMRPGAPLAFGSLFGVPWLGLPGNPVSSLVTFELYARPMIRTMIGDVRPHRRAIRVRTGQAITIAAPLTHYLRVRLEDVGDELPRAHLTGGQSSAMLASLALADALLIVPPDAMDVPAGTVLSAIPLGGELSGSDRFPA